MRHPCCWPRLPVQRRKFTALPILTLGKSPSPPTGLTVAIPSSTSSTVDGSWNTGEKVALKVDGDDATYTYTVENSQGAMSGDYYWQSTAPITVQGFYPYEAAAAAEWEVHSRQDIEENYYGSDLLVSPKEQITWEGKDNASLDFCHQTAKVVMNIVDDKFVAAIGNAFDVTINGVALSGTFDPPASGNYGTWNTDGRQASAITPHTATAADGYAATFEALVIPQPISNGTELFIFNVDGYDPFIYVPGGPLNGSRATNIPTPSPLPPPGSLCPSRRAASDGARQAARAQAPSSCRASGKRVPTNMKYGMPPAWMFGLTWLEGATVMPAANCWQTSPTIVRKNGSR